MTVLCYDTQTIYADTCVTDGNFIASTKSTKIFKISDDLFCAVVGETGMTHLLISHAESRKSAFNLLNVPEYKLDIAEMQEALEESGLITKDFDFFLFEQSTNTFVQFYVESGKLHAHRWTSAVAFGSGRRFAQGVLSIGITGEYAVIAAIRSDFCCGGSVTYVNAQGEISIDDPADILMPYRWDIAASEVFENFRP
tara:strand:+ start:6446 stop:7036 length:591 start_codon:yes stop_codon:yes gene_type:complete